MTKNALNAFSRLEYRNVSRVASGSYLANSIAAVLGAAGMFLSRYLTMLLAL